MSDKTRDDGLVVWDGEIQPSDFKVATFGGGGSWIHHPDHGVVITHIPTGFSESCDKTRSVHQNKAIAMERLQLRLSQKPLYHPHPQPQPTSESEIRQQVIEECALQAWNHFMDVCIAKGYAPALFEEWCAATAIRSLSNNTTTPRNGS